MRRAFVRDSGQQQKESDVWSCMEPVSQSEKLVTALSLRFIWAVGAHCDDKTIVAPIIKNMVANAEARQKEALSNALAEIKISLMLLGDSFETVLQEFVENRSSRAGVRLVAESFAVAAKDRMPVAVLKMAIPETAKNHRMRQLLRRKRCNALADLCSTIQPSELRIR